MSKKINQGEQMEISIKRDYAVVKHNFLVQKSRYDLTLAEQRALAYIVSLIKPTIATSATYNVPYQLEYEFDIWEYAKICGLESDGGMLYQTTKNLLKGLMIKIMYIELSNGDEDMITWFTRVRTNKRSGKAIVEINKYLVPYLFDLQNDYTIFDLLNILAMKSQYSIRIYELMRSHTYQKTVVYDTARLKKMLMIDDSKAYVRFNNVKQRILEPAMAEINKYTDLAVSYEPITKGRKVVKIQFIIKKKDAFERFLANTSANTDISGS